MNEPFEADQLHDEPEEKEKKENTSKTEEAMKLTLCEYRHKWDDGWICSRCGVRRADWVEADIKGRK